MDDTQINKYLEVDFAEAIKYYDDRALKAKRCYHWLSIYLIVVSASLTFVVAFAPNEMGWRVFSAVLSASIAVSTGLIQFFKCHENWLAYRSAWDALKREHRLHEAEAGEYENHPNKHALFVERVEAIRTTEGIGFYERHSKAKEDSKKLT